MNGWVDDKPLPLLAVGNATECVCYGDGGVTRMRLVNATFTDVVHEEWTPTEEFGFDLLARGFDSWNRKASS